MSKRADNPSHKTLYVIVAGMLLLVLANLLIAHFSDNLWRNLAIGVLLAGLLSLVVYVVIRRDKDGA